MDKKAFAKLYEWADNCNFLNSNNERASIYTYRVKVKPISNILRVAAFYTKNSFSVND